MSEPATANAEQPRVTVYDALNVVQLIEASQSIIGKEGPCYLDHGIIMHNIFLSEEKKQELADANITDKFPIGESGRSVTLQDILDTFRRVSVHTQLGEVRYAEGRSYFHEGFGLSKDGTTIEMYWGS